MSKNTTTIERSPVVAIMGHVDHGKSTLLDYIRKTNIVDGEAGGITQHLSAYEVQVGDDKRITFIDTPGHAAFDQMRNRSGSIADIAILIVSAEDGVKTQTKHAISVIKDHDIPFIVAINKIDKPNANVEKVKTDLLEEGIYVEGYGGDVSFVEISAKAGTNIDELLSTLLLVAEMEEMTGETSKPATGFVIEAHHDPLQGISATMIIKDGSIQKGQFVVIDDTMAPTRMLQTFKGDALDAAHFSTPIVICGFDFLPNVGSRFQVFDTKKEAEESIKEFKEIKREIEERCAPINVPNGVALVPIILKTDVAGTNEAILEQIEAMTDEEVIFKVIKSGTGDINESDMKIACSDLQTIIVGFHVKEEKSLKNLNEYENVTIRTFDIIYELTQYLQEMYEERRIKKEVDTELGRVNILKTFSKQKDESLIGGSIVSGIIRLGDDVKVMRHDEQVGRGKLIALQQGKQSTQSVTDEGTEFGMMFKGKTAIEERDVLIAFKTEIK